MELLPTHETSDRRSECCCPEQKTGPYYPITFNYSSHKHCKKCCFFKKRNKGRELEKRKKDGRRRGKRKQVAFQGIEGEQG